MEESEPLNNLPNKREPRTKIGHSLDSSKRLLGILLYSFGFIGDQYI